MIKKMYYRFDMDNKIWKKTTMHLTWQQKQHGGTSKDNRKFINADALGSVHIKSKSKIKAREMVEIKIESSLS